RPAPWLTGSPAAGAGVPRVDVARIGAGPASGGVVALDGVRGAQEVAPPPAVQLVVTLRTDHHVVARSPVHPVVPRAGRDGVVPSPAPDLVVPRLPADEVVARGAAEEIVAVRSLHRAQRLPAGGTVLGVVRLQRRDLGPVAVRPEQLVAAAIRRVVEED